MPAATSLVEAGAGVDCTEHSRGYSLLMMVTPPCTPSTPQAASSGHGAMVEVLLRAGADTTYR